MVCYGCATFLREFYQQYQRLMRANVDSVFRDCYAHFFIHDDGEDYQYRWQVVSPKVLNILDSVQSASELPRFYSWETFRIHDCLEKDVWYLRQIARHLREPAPSAK
ncbi:unnamed protein product [Prorocentrum cordatum]|uniref:Uncharacterized protein n=1 Tax=Prorocentrum cordatum TaxID=2364126 RepID=A0ABN9RBC5_9DINO|nr:unnamed protein product [Polarella glacialis]